MSSLSQRCIQYTVVVVEHAGSCHPRCSDSTAQDMYAKNKSAKQQQVKFNSDAYFALIKQYPEAAAWLSLGEEVDLVLGDTLYQVRG